MDKQNIRGGWEHFASLDISELRVTLKKVSSDMALHFVAVNVISEEGRDAETGRRLAS